MGFQYLEINRLSPEGAVVRRIRALPGRVTVFRSQQENELVTFRTALEGRAQAERFSVLLDGAAFRPQDHTYIGCGPLDNAPGHEPIRDYLSKWGIDEQNVEPLLMQFGLGGLSVQPCSTLTPQQWETLRIIAFTSDRRSNRVLIINDPFVNLPEQFRERVAERLVGYAWEGQAIIIVTKLSYRPQCWIENDYIARVQLERPRQGTIGFGGGDLSSAEQIAQLRKELGISASKGASSSEKATSGIDLTAPRSKQSWNLPRWASSPIALGSMITICLVLIASLFLLWRNQPQVESALVIYSPSSGAKDNSKSNGTDPKNSSVGVENSKASSDNSPAIETARVSVFKQLPEALQASWKAALNPSVDASASYKQPDEKEAKSESASLIPEVKTSSPLQPLYDELTSNS